MCEESFIIATLFSFPLSRDKCGRNYLLLEDLAKVQNTLWEARNKWYNIGLELKMMPTDLEAIEKECGKDIELCFRKMLYNVLSRSTAKHRCTWKAIINVLRTKPVHLDSLASQIEASRTEKECSDLINDTHDVKSHLVSGTCPGSAEDIGKVYACLTNFFNNSLLYLICNSCSRYTKRK